MRRAARVDANHAAISFEVPGTPRPWKRVRRGKGFSFDPPENIANKAAIGWVAKKHYSGSPLTGPVSLSVTFYFVRPKARTRKKMPDPFPYPDNRSSGDWDNLAKLVCDGLQGILFVDDSQIVSATVRKRWADDGRPRTEVRIDAE